MPDSDNELRLLRDANRALQEHVAQLEARLRATEAANAAPKPAENSRRERDDLLNTTQQLAHVGGWEWDVIQQTMTWTDETYRIHGIAPDQIVPGSPEHIRRSLDCYDPKDRPTIEEAFRRCVEQGQSYDLEFAFTAVDGRQLWIRTIAKPVLEEKRVAKVIGNIIDITEHRRMADALREESARRRILFEQSPDGIVIVDPQTARFLEYNEAAHLQLGYSRKEFAQLSIFDVEARETVEETRAHVAHVIRNGKADFVTLQRTRQGEVRHVHVTAQIVDVEGKPVYQCIWRDITERQHAEERSREANTTFARAQHIAHIGSWENFLPTGELHWSEEMYHIVGFPVNSPLSLTEVARIFPPEELARFKEAVAAAVDDGVPYSMDYRIIRPDGAVRYIHDEGDISRDEHGRAIWMHGTTQDITAHRRAEEALRESRDRFEATLASLGDAVLLVDPATRLISDCNDAALRIFGYAREEVVGKATDFLHVDPAHFEQFHHWTSAAYVNPGYFAGEFAMRRKNGAVFPTEHFVRPVRHADGRIRYVVSVVRDISARKEAEAALAAREQNFHNLAESIGDGIVIATADGQHIYANRHAAEILGYAPEEMLQTTMRDLADPAAYPQLRQRLQDRIAGRPAPATYETLVRRKDGKPFPAEVTGTRTVWQGQACDLVLFRDITERAEAERRRARADEALLKSRQEYRDLFENAVVGMYRSRLDGSAVLAVNPALCNLLGYAREEMLSKAASIHWADPRAREDFAARLREDGAVTNYPADFVTRTGEIRHCLVSAKLYPEEGYLEGTTVDITGRVQAEAARAQAEAALVAERNLLRTFIDNLPDAVYAKDLQGRKTLANRVECARLGASGEGQVLGKTNADLFPPEMAARLTAEDQRVMQTGQSLLNHEEEDQDASGARRKVSTSKVPLRNAAGRVVGLVGISRDITDQSRLQEQFAQAQKMESVGRLAGGVAHDFNNMLGVILGHAELSMQQVDPAQPLYADLQEIQRAAQRSADLTRQLLAFARRQTVAPKVLDLNVTVANTLKMLRRLIGENIDLVWQPGGELWAVRMDPAQVDQILANLCVNARDAISGTGRISLATRNATLDEIAMHSIDGAAHAGAVPGEYVLLTVRDDGCGMDQDVLEHLFEPFFTTKGLGQGTGLGLATVYGAIKQNQGYIEVQSAVGEGATFSIYLPRYVRADDADDASANEEAARAAQRGTETVLLVEDEPAILRMGRRMLAASGYHVLTASTPGEALRLAANHSGEIDLLITDVVMPEMNGQELAQRLLALCPHLKRLFMSGYTADVIADHGVVGEGVHFVQKPFTRQALASRVREALDQ